LHSVSDAQLNWLSRQLNTRKKVLLFIHHPVLKINTPIDHQMAVALKGRDEIKKVLVDSATEIIIFCGHNHMTDETAEKNIKQISTVAASYQIRKESATVEINQNTFGYRLIQVEDDSIRTETILFKTS